MTSLSHLHTYDLCVLSFYVQFCALYSRDGGLAEGPTEVQ